LYSDDVWLYLSEKDSSSNPSETTQVSLSLHSLWCPLYLFPWHCWPLFAIQHRGPSSAMKWKSRHPNFAGIMHFFFYCWITVISLPIWLANHTKYCFLTLIPLFKFLVEGLVTGLSRVSWEKVDVSFHTSKQRFAAHSVIQVI